MKGKKAALNKCRSSLKATTTFSDAKIVTLAETANKL